MQNYLAGKKLILLANLYQINSYDQQVCLLYNSIMYCFWQDFICMCSIFHLYHEKKVACCKSSYFHELQYVCNFVCSQIQTTHETNCTYEIQRLTLNAPIATKLGYFSRLLKCLRSLYGKQCGPRSDCSYRSSLIGAVWSGSTLFASILNPSVMLGSYLQQTTSADDIFRCIFFLAP